MNLHSHAHIWSFEGSQSFALEINKTDIVSECMSLRIHVGMHEMLLLKSLSRPQRSDFNIAALFMYSPSAPESEAVFTDNRVFCPVVTIDFNLYVQK